MQKLRAQKLWGNMKPIHHIFKKFISFAILTAFYFSAFSAFAQTSQTVRIGYFSDDFFHIGQNDAAIKTGYGYEYYQTIAKYTGWHYQYFYGDKNAVFAAFLDGKIDIIDGVFASDAGIQKMLLAKNPMGEERHFIFVSQFDQTTDPNNARTLNGKRIAADKNTLDMQYLKEFVAQNKLNCQIVPCGGEADRLAKLQQGEIDALVATEKNQSEGIKPAFYIGQSNFYFAVNPARPDLLDQLNKAQNKILEAEPNFNGFLHEKYYKKTVLHTTLSAEENLWLIQHPVLRAGYRAHTMPFADCDKNGNATGMIADLLPLLSSSLYAEFETVPFNSSNEMVLALQNGEVDCIFPVMDSEWISEKLNYIQTFPVIEDRLSLIYADEYKGINAYQRFGYTKGSPEQYAFLIMNGKEENSVAFETLEDSLKSLRKGQVDAIIMNAGSWNYYRNSFPQYDLLKSVNIDAEAGYSFAVNRNNPILYSILQNGLKKVEKSTLIESLNRNSQVKSDYSLLSFVRHNFAASMTFACLLLAILFIAGSAHQRNLMRHQYLKFSSEHDALTGVFNRNAFDQITAELEKSSEPLSLVIIDIDNFKQINDNFGHQVGDKIIKEVSVQLSKIVRASDKVFRYGGDEFVLIMPNALLENRGVISDKIAGVNAVLNRHNENLPGTTISAGCAFSLNGYSKQLFRNADNALYTVKRQGKNNCGFDLSVLK